MASRVTGVIVVVITIVVIVVGGVAMADARWWGEGDFVVHR